MHPSDADGLEWDEANESELARHHVSPIEAEQVFENGPTWAPNKHGRAGDRIMVGRTDGGRVLTIVVRLRAKANALRPVTGWDSTAGERTRYLRR